MKQCRGVLRTGEQIRFTHEDKGQTSVDIVSSVWACDKPGFYVMVHYTGQNAASRVWKEAAELMLRAGVDPFSIETMTDDGGWTPLLEQPKPTDPWELLEQIAAQTDGKWAIRVAQKAVEGRSK